MSNTALHAGAPGAPVPRQCVVFWDLDSAPLPGRPLAVVDVILLARRMLVRSSWAMSEAHVHVEAYASATTAAQLSPGDRAMLLGRRVKLVHADGDGAVASGVATEVAKGLGPHLAIAVVTTSPPVAATVAPLLRGRPWLLLHDAPVGTPHERGLSAYGAVATIALATFIPA